MHFPQKNLSSKLFYVSSYWFGRRRFSTGNRCRKRRRRNSSFSTCHAHLVATNLPPPHCAIGGFKFTENYIPSVSSLFTSREAAWSTGGFSLLFLLARHLVPKAFAFLFMIAFYEVNLKHFWELLHSSIIFRRRRFVKNGNLWFLVHRSFIIGVVFW